MILETCQLATKRHFLTSRNQSGWKAWVAALEILSTMEASAISGDEVSLLVQQNGAEGFVEPIFHGIQNPSKPQTTIYNLNIHKITIKIITNQSTRPQHNLETLPIFAIHTQFSFKIHRENKPQQQLNPTTKQELSCSKTNQYISQSPKPSQQLTTNATRPPNLCLKYINV